jgi:subtilisin family serine protease
MQPVRLPSQRHLQAPLNATSASAAEPAAAIHDQAEPQLRDVIVVPATQDAEIPGSSLARARALLQEVGAAAVREMKAVSAVVARVPQQGVETLRAAGFEVVEDRVLHHDSPAGAPEHSLTDAAKGSQPSAGAKRPVFQGPLGSLSSSPGYTGKGVGIAIIDSGVAPVPDLRGRLVAFDDEVDGGHKPCDGFGHGTHVAGDAAGSGLLSHGQFAGAAPGANIVGIRVLGDEDSETLSSAVDHMVAGIDWMIANQERYNIRVANLSLGLPLEAEGEGEASSAALTSAITRSIDKAIAHGIAVVVSAGNDGEQGRSSIKENPAINPQVITVGALDTKGTADPSDDGVAPFSSRGPTPSGLAKPDLVAPGVNIMSLNAPESALQLSNQSQATLKGHIREMSAPTLRRYAQRMVDEGQLSSSATLLGVRELRKAMVAALDVKPFRGERGGSPAYVAMDGTSMAAPIVAGVIADMVEANPQLSPAQIKDILIKTAHKLPAFNANSQGAGVVDPAAATRLAAQMRSFPHATFTLPNAAPST